MPTKSATIMLGIMQQHPVNAYELIKMLSKLRLKDWYEIADSTVYATIKSLEKKEYIIGKIERDGNMPDKTIYSLTAAGNAALEDTLKSFLSHFEYDLVPFMIASFFIESIGLENAQKCLQKRLSHLEKNKTGLLLQIEKLQNDSDIPHYVIGNVEHNLLVVETEIIATKKLIAHHSFR